MIEIILNRWPVIYGLSTVIFGIVVYILAKTYAKREVVDALAGRVESIERQVANLPNQGDFHRLQLDMAALRGDIKEVSAILGQVKYISNLVTDHKFKEKS